MLRTLENGIQDRTSSTETREILEVLDTDWGGKGFKTSDKNLTVEIIFKTTRNPSRKMQASFKSWEELKNIMKNEKHFNIIIYYRLIKRYRHLIEKIEKHKIEISSTLPTHPHWSYTMLKVGGKGCSHLRRLSNPQPQLD